MTSYVTEYKKSCEPEHMSNNPEYKPSYVTEYKKSCEPEYMPNKPEFKPSYEPEYKKSYLPEYMPYIISELFPNIWIFFGNVFCEKSPAHLLFFTFGENISKRVNLNYKLTQIDIPKYVNSQFLIKIDIILVILVHISFDTPCNFMPEYKPSYAPEYRESYEPEYMPIICPRIKKTLNGI